MATPLNTILSWFEAGDVPTQEQFQQTFSAFRHKDLSIPFNDVQGLTSAFQNTVSSDSYERFLEDLNITIQNLVKVDASNLSDAQKLLWKQALGIQLIATVDSSVESPDGNVYNKQQIIDIVDLLHAKIDGLSLEETITSIEDPLLNGSALTIIYNNEASQMQRRTVDLTPFKNEVLAAANVGYKGFLKKTDTAPSGGWVSGLYKLLELGTYSNLSPAVDSLGNTVTITSVDGKVNEAYFNGTNWISSEISFPQPYYNTAPLDPVSLNKAETGKTVSDYVAKRVEILDSLFQKVLQEIAGIQKTANGTISTSSVTDVYGVSASIGVVSAPFSSVTVGFAQQTSTPVTMIEIRLFQGKTAGGTLISKKRKTFTAGATVQTSTVITFDTPITYSGEMWCQILVNAPFSYKRNSASVQRTAAAGYGTPYITKTNNLDGTVFDFAQGYVDLYLEFNTLGPVIQTTSLGTETILSLLTETTDIDITGYFMPANSYLKSDGLTTPSGNWRTSELIPVTAGKSYKLRTSTVLSTSAVSLVGYDVNGVPSVLVGNGDYWLNPINVIIPAGIVNVKTCGYVGTPPTLKVTERKLHPNLVSSTGKIKINKVWNCVGHSIWWRDGVPFDGTTEPAKGIQTHVRKIFDFEGVNKYCYSGNSLGAIAAGDTSSIANKLSVWGDSSPAFWTVDTITNDFKRNVPIGTIADYNNATGTTTYYGALRVLRDKINSLSPGAPVIVANALRRNNDGKASFDPNDLGHKLPDYERALLTIAGLNNWYFVDQFRFPVINDDNLDLFTYDGLHLTNFGYGPVGKLWVEALKTYLFL